MRTLPRIAATAAELAVLAHLGPAVTGIPGLLFRVAPALAGRRGPGEASLTFDDGPHPQGTPAVLDALADHGATATFFLVGEDLRRHPDIGRLITEHGHQIGVHGWNHRPLPTQSPQATYRGIRDTRDVIAEMTGTAPRWWRPPYGIATGTALAAAAACDLTPIWWTRWGRDWTAQTTPTRISHRVLGHPMRGGGDTVLLHDSDRYGHRGSWKTTTAALPLILSGYSERGWRIVPLDLDPDPDLNRRATPPGTRRFPRIPW